MIELAIDGFYRLKYEPMREWAERAVDAARPLHERPLTAAAVAVLTLACAWNGLIAEGESHRAEAAALVEALTEAELAKRLDAAANLAAAELYLDRYEEAGAHAERAMAVGRATGQGAVFPVLVPVLGTVRTVRGQFVDAADLLDDAVEAARLSGNEQVLAWHLLNRSVLASSGTGEVEIALTTAEEAVQLTREMEQSLISAWSGVALGKALLQADQAAVAADVIVNAAGGEELPLIPGGWRVNCLELLTRCWLTIDRPQEARRSAAAAESRAAIVGLPFAAAMAHRAAAAVALDSGDAAAAAERALDSAAGAAEIGAPIEAALSRMLAGRALAVAGDTPQAIAELERAVATFEAYGALRHRDEAERELRSLGHRVHRRTRPGKTDGTDVESLTEREFQVARLVVDRRTNPEIAAALFLSQKTVETHLRNMFRKLGVASRVELARTVERADRVESARSGLSRAGRRVRVAGREIRVRVQGSAPM